MAKKNITKSVEEIFTSLEASDFADYELVDTVFVKEGQRWYLRIFVDKEGGISLDDCTKISKLFNRELDRIDLIDKEYILEVSSPSIERPLKKAKDFIRFKGETIEVKLYAALNGRKKIAARLDDFIDGKLLITPLEEKEQLEIALEDIAQAKKLFIFN